MMKQIFKYLIISTLFIFVPRGSQAQDFLVFKSKKELRKEILRYRQILDSLGKEINALKDSLTQKDSIISELLVEEVAYKDSLGMEENIEGEVIPEQEDSVVYTQEVTDSLFQIWYREKNLTTNPLEFNMDSVKFSSNVPDSVYIQRLQAMNSFISLPFNDMVKNYIILYSEKMPSHMAKVLGACEYYMPLFDEIFNKYKLPQELKVMAIIESAMNPKAISRANARGMWQFMYQTAKKYGLEINSFVDARYDPIQAADAAARYLKDAYEIFGDWSLAISSYNCGAGNINRAIRRSGGKVDYWSIYPYLPRETRGYVPAFVAALYTLKYHKEHGIRPNPNPIYAHVDTFKVNKMLHFKQIEELVGIDNSVLRELNPQYIHNIIPGTANKEYILRIPFAYSNKFIAVEDSLYKHKAKEYFNPVAISRIKSSDYSFSDGMVYKVKKGDILGSIARKFHVSVANIRRWNHLRNNNLRIGQKLRIYKNGYTPPKKTESSKREDKSGQKEKSMSQEQAPQIVHYKDYVLYTIGEGESLYIIAKRFPGVTADDIMKYNGISSKLKPGQKIKIPKVKK